MSNVNKYVSPAILRFCYYCFFCLHCLVILLLLLYCHGKYILLHNIVCFLYTINWYTYDVSYTTISLLCIYIFRRMTILYTTHMECIIITKQTVQIHNDLNIEVQINMHVIFHVNWRPVFIMTWSLILTTSLKGNIQWPEGWYWTQPEGRYSQWP
jgi:hypothetical protein